MGKQVLPSISKIEEVLDLLLDPQKYKQYLVEFQQVYADAQAALGQLAKKDLADNYLSQATSAREEALQLVKETELKAQDVIKEKVALESAKQSVQVAEQAAAIRLEDLTRQYAKLDEKVKLHEDEKAAFQEFVLTQKAALQASRQDLAEQRTAFEERRAKLAAAVGEA